MPHFVIVTPPEGSQATEAILGPFESLASAELSRAAMLADGMPEGTVIGEAFEESLSWHRARPKPQTTIPQDDGSILEIWTDGSQRILQP